MSSRRRWSKAAAHEIRPFDFVHALVALDRTAHPHLEAEREQLPRPVMGRPIATTHRRVFATRFVAWRARRGFCSAILSRR